MRNQIVMGIGHGELKPGEQLPTIRQMAIDAGVNTMTVNKTYQILKSEGFIVIDRRHGAIIQPVEEQTKHFMEKLKTELELLSAEASIKGITKGEFIKMCESAFDGMVELERGNEL